MARRRWIADTWDAKTAALSGEQATHLIRVLRAKPGMEFDVVAGGHVFRAVISGVGATGVQLELKEELDAASALPLTLLLAVTKFDRFEYALEKTTELGVEQIIPVLARRTEKHLAQAAPNRLERWRRVVREAAQQSRRSDQPTIQAPQSLRAALAQTVAPGTLTMLLSETELQQSLRACLDKNSGAKEFRLAIGPEGGWTADEFALFQEAQWTAVTLGPRILRAETAAMAATAICSAWLA
jgi:16S rRNA (uracil1498-N3)-methyltransferase